jgi:hypothetical protein
MTQRENVVIWNLIRKASSLAYLKVVLLLYGLLRAAVVYAPTPYSSLSLVGSLA